MRTVAIIQARSNSSRLPGKVLADIEGRPMLQRVVDRARRATTLEDVVVATSSEPTDDSVADFCETASIACFRGHEADVLDRYYHAARSHRADPVVRLTADCPLLDPRVIDTVVQTFQHGDYDYVSNTLECTFPDGLDTEILRFAALDQAWREARWSSEREHVTPYIIKHPERFRLACVRHEEDLSSLRWTVDEPSDLALVRTVYRYMQSDVFGMDDVLNLLHEHPELGRLNHMIQRNEGYARSLRADRLVERANTCAR